MNVGLRNFKILKAFSKTNLPYQQYAVRPLSTAVERKQFNYKNICCHHENDGVGVVALSKFNQLRRTYSNISPKPADREEKLKNKQENADDEDDNKNEPESNQSEKRTLPRLMVFPEIMWPSMLNSIKNWIMVQFIIRPYMDREFNIRDFAKGAKKAMQVISAKLMDGDFSHLGDLVSTDALNEIKPIVQKLSVSQRRQLEVKESDIYLTFPYQIGIMFDEDNEEAQKRWVEITMVFHVLRGLKELRDSGEEIPWNMGMLPEYQDKVFVCNYRFVKEFTKGQESDWTVNIVNHFKPIDLINELKTN